MNAKKIMGAVLVALIAAALFVGAGAAADEEPLITGGANVVYAYNYTSALTVGDIWTDEKGNSLTVVEDPVDTGKLYLAGDSMYVVEGKYSNGTNYTTVKNPSAVVTAYAGESGKEYKIIGGNYFVGDKLELKATANVGAKVVYVITTPDEVVYNNQSTALSAYNFPEEGQYTVQIVLKEIDGVFDFPTGYAEFPLKDKYTITAIDAEKPTIAASATEVNIGEEFTVTVTGKPSLGINVTLGEYFKLVSNGTTNAKEVDSVNHIINLTIPANGKAVLYLAANTTTGDGDINVYLGTDADNSDSVSDVTITVNAGTITAAAEKASYFVGDNVKISGTSTAGDLYVFLAGTNVDFKQVDVKKDSTTTNTIKVAKDGSWEAEIPATEFLKDGSSKIIDAGTYTIYVASNVPSSMDVDGLKTYTTVSVLLKQPFISVTDAPTVAVLGSDYVVKGTAEAATDVYAYVFGTNFFAAANKTAGYKVVSDSSKVDTFTVKVDETEFTITFKGNKDKLSTGQYFMVIQHPMYDKAFNIYPAIGGDAGDIMLLGSSTPLFNVYERQTANAAQALCDELEKQSIDDMYVKLSFVVAGQSSVINPIPSEITQGSKLTVSGQTNVGEGKIVTVDMVASAFAAVPKETVGSASFISLTTKTLEDGSWEITFDTTGLNIDEYIVTATVEGLNSATATVNVIEGAPTEQPTENPTEQPTQTEQPTTPPTTPGFGALAALAGLGAVAVLLLRRE